MSIELSDLREQDAIMQCPYCYVKLDVKNIIGETVYDVCRIGHNIGGLAVVLECPKCFEKSFFHKENLKYIR